MALSTGKVVALIQAMGGGADPAVIESAVQDWLDAHPEATTTVQDGSITEQKLATSIAQKLGLISSLSDEIDDVKDMNVLSLSKLSEFVIGVRNDTTGAIMSVNYGVTNSTPISFDSDTTLTADDGYKYRYFLITDGNIQPGSSWVQSHVFETNQEFYIVIVENSLAAADIDLFASKIHGNIYYKIVREVLALKQSTGSVDWTGFKWATMGDSITEKNAKASKNYIDYITEKTGIVAVNLGLSGTGYKNQWNANAPFYLRTDTIPIDSDAVTIFGSGNDLGHGYELGEITDTGTTTICGCINTTIDNIQSRIPLVHLGIITPCPWDAYNPIDNTNLMAQYASKIVEICKARSIPCLDLYHCSNLRPWDASFRALAYTKDNGDGVHPDENGHKLIAPQIRDFLFSLLL